jgi:chemotaxis family two-component system sensor kinase Cph1
MVDLTDCDREPIHVPGTVQPFGVLLALNPEMRVVQVSENVPDLLSMRAQDVLGRPLSDLVDPTAADEVREILQKECWNDANPVSISASGKSFDGIVHRHEGAAILELEPNPETPKEQSIHHPFRAAILRVQRTSTLSDLSSIMTQEMRRATGFERVMFYRFHEDGSGSVDAEAKAVGLEAYLGLRYPASDIPSQARRLYLKNWIRLIYDTRQKPARIVPALRPDTGEPLDLTFSVLRSVSPIHLEYMENMGVRASMSVSLIVRDRLWGLISCLNHTGPRRVSHSMRLACEFMGRLASLQIAAFEDRAIAGSRASRRATEDELHRTMLESQGSVLAALLAHPKALMQLVDAGGAAVLNGDLVMCGHVPPSDVIREIASWLDEKGDLRPFATASLGALFPPALAASDVASGLLTFALPGARLMWFRPEIIQTVNWGGNPAKPADQSKQGLRPRQSFELWKEEVRSCSAPWTPSDLEAADELQRRGIEVDIKRRLASEQRAVRARDELLSVVSHDLKNPLLAIELQAGQLLTALPESGDGSVLILQKPLQRIWRSTMRMKALIDDLVDLTMVGTENFPLETQSLESRELLEEAISDAQPLADAKHVSLVMDLVDPPRINADAPRMSQILSNLLGNAIKFTPAGGSVTLRARPLDGMLLVSISDTGSGIAPEDLPFVFERYWRAKGSNVEGTGLGLYIARGLVEAHGGRIWAESPPIGATLTFTFPLGARPDERVTRRATDKGADVASWLAPSGTTHERRIVTPNFMNSRPPVRLLLIEDHAEMAEVTADILCRYGMDVRIASCGQEALETATVLRPDIILCDLFLQDMSGLELARVFRSRPETKDALIALHTAMPEMEVSTLEAEANATEIDLFLSKPVTKEKVDKLFARFALRRQAS